MRLAEGGIVREIAKVADIMQVMSVAFDPDHREAWTQDQVEAAMLIPGTHIIGATLDQILAGFTLSRTLLGECELLLIGVIPQARSKALGAMLLEATIANAKKLGAEKLFLEVRITNPAISFYNRHGFKIIGERRHYYVSKRGEPLNALTMSVDIV